MRLPFFLQLPDEDMIKQFTRLCSSFLSYLSLLHDLEIYTRSNGANQWEFSTQINFNYILKHPISTYKCETTEPIWYCETFAAQPSHIVSQTQVTLLRFTRSSYKFEISKSTAIIKNYFEKVKCTKRMFLDNNSISLRKLKRSKVSQHIFLFCIVVKIHVLRLPPLARTRIRIIQGLLKRDIRLGSIADQ